MVAKANLIDKAAITAKAREVDFVSMFSRDWEHLQNVLGISRPIRKAPGTKLKIKTVTGTLQSGTVNEGEDIPYSKFSISEKDAGEIAIEKYAKAVSVEAIAEYGYDVAVQMTDDEFRAELTDKVADKFYKFANTGTITGEEKTWQMALAMARGKVVNQFKKIHRRAMGVVAFVNTLDVYEYMGSHEVTIQSEFGFEYVKNKVVNQFKKIHRRAMGVVAFVNTLDVYEYMGSHEVTIQSEFGFEYVKNFLGYDTVFLLGDDEVKKGRVIATPMNNLCLYYVDPSDSDFVRAGLDYTTAGETNLIGYHVQGNYNTAVSECFALMGMALFAEFLDAIAVLDVKPAAAAAAYAASKALSAMTKDELVAYAEDNGIVVDPEATKDAIYQTIKDAE